MFLALVSSFFNALFEKLSPQAIEKLSPQAIEKLSPQAIEYVSNSTYLRYHSLTISGKLYQSSENRSTTFIIMVFGNTLYMTPPTYLPPYPKHVT